MLLIAGVHPRVVQERLGHSQIAVTLGVYSHVLPTMQADAAAKVQGILAGGCQMAVKIAGEPMKAKKALTEVKAS